MYLVFDTETADAPPKNKVIEATPENDYSIWPRLVQLAFVLYDKYRNPIKEYDKIMKPDGKFIIQPGAQEVHKISIEMAEEMGIPPEEIFPEFYDALSKAKYIICHNIKFDSNIIKAEHVKNKIKTRPPKNERITICTMLESIYHCNLPPKYKSQKEPKWPSLEELHEKLFGYNFDGAHNAMVDVKATARCFWELIDKNVITLNDDNVLKKEFVETHPDSDIVTYDDFCNIHYTD